MQRQDIPVFTPEPLAAAAATVEGLAPQVEAAGVLGLGPLPRAGNNSSDCTSKAGLPLGADLGAEAGVGAAAAAAGAGI